MQSLIVYSSIKFDKHFIQVRYFDFNTVLLFVLTCQINTSVKVTIWYRFNRPAPTLDIILYIYDYIVAVSPFIDYFSAFTGHHTVPCR